MRFLVTGGEKVPLYGAGGNIRDWRYSLDATRVRELGWKPAHDFKAGLAETIDWYRDNRAWWRPLKPLGANRTLDHGRAPEA